MGERHKLGVRPLGHDWGAELLILDELETFATASGCGQHISVRLARKMVVCFLIFPLDQPSFLHISYHKEVTRPGTPMAYITY